MTFSSSFIGFVRRTFFCFVLVLSSLGLEAAEYVPSPLTAGLRPLLDLSGEWRSDQGNNVVVPFVDEESSGMQLSRWLTLPGDRDKDKQLYLYIEAVAWHAEIYLNDHLLKVSEDPFAEHLIPIEKDWISPEGDHLRIVMDRNGQDFLMYPKPFIGIFRGVYLLETDTVSTLPVFSEPLAFADQAIVLAPWSEEHSFLKDEVVLGKYTRGLFAIPPDIPVFTPFRPSNAALAELEASGRKLLFSVEGVDSIAFYNAYPMARKPEILHPEFWRMGNERPTSEYGQFQSWTELRMPKTGPLNRVALLSLLLLPVLGLLVVRLGIPKVYDSLPEYLSRTKIFLELIGNNKYLKTGQRFLMNLVRISVVSAAVSLFLYYLSESGSLYRLNVWSDSSVLYEFLSGNDLSAFEILGFTFLVLLAMNVGKYFLLNMAGGIFRLNSFSATVQALDVFSSFPLNLLPLLPLVFIFFVDYEIGSILLIVFYVFFFAFLLRRIILIFTGISRLFSFSVSLKFLYICTFEILPWVLLL